jgi:hypothetical protein
LPRYISKNPHRLNFGSIRLRLAPPLLTLCSVSLNLAHTLLSLASGCSCSAQLSSGSGFWDLSVS